MSAEKFVTVRLRRRWLRKFAETEIARHKEIFEELARL